MTMFIQVGAGDVIGTVTKSKCSASDHIHFAIRKDRGTLDPSKYLGLRLISIKYEQACDDYRLVFKVRNLVFSSSFKF